MTRSSDYLTTLAAVVVVWTWDRFTCEGLLETFQYVRQLNASESSLRATTGERMLAIAPWTPSRSAYA